MVGSCSDDVAGEDIEVFIRVGSCWGGGPPLTTCGGDFSQLVSLRRILSIWDGVVRCLKAGVGGRVGRVFSRAVSAVR